MWAKLWLRFLTLMIKTVLIRLGWFVICQCDGRTPSYEIREQYVRQWIVTLYRHNVHKLLMLLCVFKKNLSVILLLFFYFLSVLWRREGIKRGAHLPLVSHGARRWINHWSLLHGQCDAWPTVTFPAVGHHRPLTDRNLYCLVTEAHVCEQLA